MGYWMEVRCDAHSADGCLSDRNEGPMGMAQLGTRDLTSTASFLRGQALRQGWVIKNGEFVCPQCRKASTTQEAEKP